MHCRDVWSRKLTFDDGHEDNLPSTVTGEHVVHEPNGHEDREDECEPLGSTRDELLPFRAEFEDEGIVESGVDEQRAHGIGVAVAACARETLGTEGRNPFHACH